MTDQIRFRDITQSKWLPDAVLIVILYLIDSPTFLTDYLMNDEWAHIGTHSSNILMIAINHFLFNGRPIFGVLNNWVFGFVGFDPFKIQIIRFLAFLSMAGIALVLLHFLAKFSQHRWFSIFVVLLLFSQSSIQGLQGYSLLLISNSQPAIWFSLAAFYLFFFAFKKRQVPLWLQGIIVFLTLILAMHSMQTYAFFAMIPLSYLALSNWKHQKRRIWSFLVISLLVFVISSIAYKFAVDFSHTHGGPTYPLAEQAFGALRTEPIKVILTAINPTAYWNAFELWTYPFPFHYTLPSESLKRVIASRVMLIWSLFIAAAIATELRNRTAGDRKEIVCKWLAVLAAMSFGALFMIADSPTRIVDHRPHMALTMTGVVIFSAAYSFQVLATNYRFWRQPIVNLVIASLALYIAFGAQADMLRGIVYTRQAQIDFIRTEMTTRDPTTYNKIIVVTPESGGCITAPCDPWFGQIIQSKWHIQRPQVYRYALATLGIPPDSKTISFVDSASVIYPDDVLLIDWNQFIDARMHLANHLRQLEQR